MTPELPRKAVSRATKKTLLIMTSTLILLLASLQLYETQHAPVKNRARAAQWVLTTAWMLEQYHDKYGVFHGCGGDAPPCWRLLGWRNFQPRLEGFSLEVRLLNDGYVVEAKNAQGAWRLERGEAIHWQLECLEERLQKRLSPLKPEG